MPLIRSVCLAISTSGSISILRSTNSLGIPGFQFYVGRTSNKLKCRLLTGTEKLKVFKLINVKLLPSLSDALTLKIQRLWNEFLALNGIFSKRPKEIMEILTNSTKTHESGDNYSSRRTMTQMLLHTYMH